MEKGEVVGIRLVAESFVHVEERTNLSLDGDHHVSNLLESHHNRPFHKAEDGNPNLDSQKFSNRTI